MSFPFKINSQLKAFTLNELLIVLVIIGILTFLALPNLMPLITKAKSKEAELQLKHMQTLQKTNFYTYSSYTDDMEQLGFEQEKLVTDGGSANYKIEVVKAGTNGFLARATAVVDFDGDGEYNVWEVSEEGRVKEVVKD
jgi:type IV pilus assembly protein PilE